MVKVKLTPAVVNPPGSTCLYIMKTFWHSLNHLPTGVRMTPQSQRQTIQKLHAALGESMKLLDQLEQLVAEYRATNRQLAAQLAELISKTKSGD